MTERDLFIEALQRCDLAERAAYLEQACAGDDVLRRRVYELLEANALASAELGANPPDGATVEFTLDPLLEGAAPDSNLDPPSTVLITDATGPAPIGETKMLSTDGESDHDFRVDISGLAQFEILAELGRGGMGVVYKARHRQLNRLVALKMIGEGRHASGEVRERFLIEAEAVARLRHPNIVHIYEIGEADGRPYVLLELLEGGSLADRLKGTTQPGRAAAELMVTLALAMHAAHQAGIVHRDLKPANILFDRDGTPRISDFGLAKRLEVAEPRTETGQIMGTPSYMAPEQARGEARAIGPPADIYALGAVLYEMLTGKPPFKGSSVMETIHMVVYDDVVPPSRIDARIPRDVETICLKCLEKEPQKRYASAAELAEDLQRYLDDRPIHARPTPLSERSKKWVRRHPTTTTLIALGAVAMLALVGAAVRYDADRRAAARAEDLRVERLRGESEGALDEAQRRLLARDWADGRLIRNLTNRVAVLKSEDRLADVRRRAEHMLAEAGRGAQNDVDAQNDRKRQQEFRDRRDAAYVREIGYSGIDLPMDVQQTRKALSAALEVFAVPEPDERWSFSALPRTLDPNEQAEIREDCYQLLLALAEAIALAQSGEDRVVQAERGLKTLDQAVGLRSQPAPTYHRLRAECLARKGDAAAAERERHAADRLQPTTALDHFLAGHDAYKRRDWKTALEEFDTTLRSQPGHFWAQCLSAIASLQLSQPGVAKFGLNSCIERHERFAWLYLLRGCAAGQAAVQARAAGQSLGIAAGSIEAAAEAQFDAGEADFREALALLDAAPNGEIRYAVLVDRANMRFQRGRLDDSVADLRAATELDPRRYNAIASLAQLLQRQRKWDEAIGQFTRAIALEPDLAALYRGRAAVQEERDDQSAAHRAAALRDLDEAIVREDPRNTVRAADYCTRATLLRRERRYNEALAGCDAALAIEPQFEEAHRLRVKLLLDLDRPDDVIRSCDGALARGKPWPDIFEIRGLARASRGDFVGAIEDYSHALWLRPGQARVLSSRGLAYVVTEAPRLALHDFDEALRIDSSSAEAHSGRGLALVLLGEIDAAIAAAEESLRVESPTDRRAYNAARVYAQAAVAAADEIGQKGRLAMALVNRYQDRAVALIKLALERTPAGRRAAFFQTQVAADPALRTLQRRLRALQP
jgi:tetratricopeptide (TPR) repeat protein/tRNA A-37 threonylcarbamoyl transferase component Bud32